MTSATRASAFATSIISVLCAVATPVHAQDYPNHSINVVVPFPAGGPSDVVARIVAAYEGLPQRPATKKP